MSTTRKLQVEDHYRPKSGRTSTRSAGALVERVQSEGLSVQWQLETHAHQDP